MREEERTFLNTIQAQPQVAAARAAYAEWLTAQDDPRSAFLQQYLAVQRIPPDHPQRLPAEQHLSVLRRGLDRDWLAIVEPDHVVWRGRWSATCDCLPPADPREPWSDLAFHQDTQDTECAAWQRLLELIEQAAADGRVVFEPLRELPAEDIPQLVSLPPTIAKLKAVTQLFLYRSHLVRLPPEIGEMESLERFDPYTSHRLHWFPYEITRCRNLKDSTVSTRSLYGNYKYRPPFPRLEPYGEEAGVPLVQRPCSVCGQPFADRGLHRVWISLWVGTDALPLLVNACSPACIERLPSPPHEPLIPYVPHPHRGGLEVHQPPTLGL